jgi:hypothetical protein
MGPKKQAKNIEEVTPSKTTPKKSKSGSKTKLDKTDEKVILNSNLNAMSLKSTRHIKDNEESNEDLKMNKKVEKQSPMRIYNKNASNNININTNNSININNNISNSNIMENKSKVSFLEITKFLKPTKVASTSISPNSKFLNRLLEPSDDHLKNNSFSQKFLPNVNAVDRKDRKLSLQNNDFFKSENPEGKFIL